MEAFLMLNGFELRASVDEQETVVLRLASGELEREAFTSWVEQHVMQRATPA
jgi:death-on-curing protein